MEKLIEALLERQRKSGENDQAFGRRLGMSRALWNAVRHGRRRLTEAGKSKIRVLLEGK